jgi:hypothetical protein
VRLGNEVNWLMILSCSGLGIIGMESFDILSGGYEVLCKFRVITQ